jgi:predicted tellurium resistance membrane protein TerC
VELLRRMVSGDNLPFPTSQEFWLGMAIMMEIPIAMVLLSRVLEYRVNRWANIIAGLVMTLVQIGSNFVGTAPTLHYIFYSVIEIASTIFIAVYAWRWRKQDNKVGE